MDITIKEDGTIHVDNKQAYAGPGGMINLHVTVEGDVGNLEAAGSVECYDVKGNINAGGSVECGDVGKSVSCGGSIECGMIGGSVNAGGSVECIGISKP